MRSDANTLFLNVMARRSAGHPGDAGIATNKIERSSIRRHRARLQLGGPHSGGHDMRRMFWRADARLMGGRL
jgi:hypothetical protein